MTVNVIKDSGKYDEICAEAAKAEGVQHQIEETAQKRPGTTKLWLELNEAAYVRGDIELADFERGLDAIYGSGALPDWIFKGVTMQVERPIEDHPPFIQVVGCGCPICTDGVEF